MKLIGRIQQGLPKDNDTLLIHRFKWFLFGVRVSAYFYGTCNNRYARKHKRHGNVQFILWKKGDQKYINGVGHTDDVWVDFDKSWWDSFLLHSL